VRSTLGGLLPPSDVLVDRCPAGSLQQAELRSPLAHRRDALLRSLDLLIDLRQDLGRRQAGAQRGRRGYAGLFWRTLSRGAAPKTADRGVAA
jgi:hypothetical protein